MAREIKELVFYVKEPYKKTRVVEAGTWNDFAKYLCTLKKKRYTKPSLYRLNFATLKSERISYRELYDYVKKYGEKGLADKFKKLFYVN